MHHDKLLSVAWTRNLEITLSEEDKVRLTYKDGMHISLWPGTKGMIIKANYLCLYVYHN